MTNIIEVAYEGSTAVRVDGRPYRYSRDQARGGVLPKVARKLIGEGANPDSIIRVSRNGTKVFADASLGQWAGITYEEADNAPRSIRRRIYRPHSSEREPVRTGGEMPREGQDASDLLLTAA